jgi:hypothetical protein
MDMNKESSFIPISISDDLINPFPYEIRTKKRLPLGDVIIWTQKTLGVFEVDWTWKIDARTFEKVIKFKTEEQLVTFSLMWL